MKRPILVAIIGYIIGIIWGIYNNKSISLFWFAIIAIYYFTKNIFRSKNKFKILSIKRYFRYIKLYINKKNLILIILMSLISNITVNYYNKKYDNIYQNMEKINTVAIVESNKIEKEYNNIYKIKIEKTNIYLYAYVNKNIEIEYGDKVYLKGEYKKPSTQRNYKGFDYSKYLKGKKIYGTIKCNEVKKIKSNNKNVVFKYSNKIHNILKDKISKNMSDETKDIFLGIILGETKNIDENTIENFRTSSMSHILAISGMHISYIILGVSIGLKKLVGYRKSKYITILTITMYMFIVGFSASVVRATIMGILTTLANILYKKSDTMTNISFSAFVLLIYNPFIIYDLGFQFSYAGTISIVLFNKTVFNLLKTIKNKYKKSVLDNKFGESLAVIISAQILIFIVSVIHYSTLGLYFILTNLLTSIIIGPIIIIGLVYVIILIINIKLASFIELILSLLIKVLILISNFSVLPFSKIYIPTPNIIGIIMYFIIIFSIQIWYYIYITSKSTITKIRLKNTIALIKFKTKPKLKKIGILTLLFIAILSIYLNIPKDLRIYFIDVGQGDSTFIITPKNKTILLDGGGKNNSNFDIGKSVILPYILNRGYTSVDYLLISHFDYDHVRRIDVCYGRNKYKKYNYWKAI